MIGAIIQARMTSSRLPGKVLLPIKGRPIIDYLFAQLRHVRQFDKIVLATTVNKEDDPLVDYAENIKIDYFRGSEHDVLERYYQVAVKFGFQHIMRITGDCPLIDPQICEKVIETYFLEETEFVHTGSTFAEGLDCEIFSFNALKEAHFNAELELEREHATLYLHHHATHYKKISLENDSDDSKYRFTLDQPEDFQVISEIIGKIYLKEFEYYTAKKVKTFLDQHPKVFNLNSHIIRNEGLEISIKNEVAYF